MSGESVEQPPIVNITGDKVALGPLRRDLLPLYQRWVNDFGVMRTRGRSPGPATLEQQEAEYARLTTSDAARFFTIYDRATWQPIGDTGLMGIDFRNGTAGFAISISEPSFRGRGYGTETTRLMLDYAFTALGLHNVELYVYEYNLAGQNAYRKAGFREIGRRRECRWFAGRRWDEIAMDCLATEFVSPVLGKVFVADEAR